MLEQLMIRSCFDMRARIPSSAAVMTSQVGRALSMLLFVLW